MKIRSMSLQAVKCVVKNYSAHFRSAPKNAVQEKALQKKAMRKVALIAVLIAMTGCGKFKSPSVPEAVTPDAVASLMASATQGGVVLTWVAPNVDRRDKKLKSLEGYRVERKDVKSASDIDPSLFAVAGPDSGFVLLSELQDTSLENLEKMREQARLDRKPMRRAKAEDELTHFKYEDNSVKPGDHLIYRIVPVNEYGMGRVARLARVVFRGIGSDITYPEPEVVDEDLNFNPFE